VFGNLRVGLRVPTFRGQPTLRPWLAPTWHSVQCPLKLSGPSWLINPALGFRFESHPCVAWPVGPNELCREDGGGALVGGKFRAYSAAKAAVYAFRPFILRIRHAQGAPRGLMSKLAWRWTARAICMWRTGSTTRSGKDFPPAPCRRRFYSRRA
jgi:hypothetical protein